MDYSEKAAVLLHGAYDLHLHTWPSFFPRSLNTIELAENLVACGMAGAVIKAHQGSSVDQAAVATLHIGGRAQVYGMVVLNTFVGGINPAAVEAGVKLGAKVISMPTITARNHVNLFGGLGFNNMPDAHNLPANPKKPLTILDERGKLIPEVYEIFDLVKEHDVVLATGHLSKEEGMVLCREAVGKKLPKVLFTHPDFKTSLLPMDAKRELTSLGVLIERTGIDFDPAQAAADILELGVEHYVLVSDFGQTYNPVPHIGLAGMLDALMQHGLKERDLMFMICDTPARLLNI